MVTYLLLGVAGVMCFLSLKDHVSTWEMWSYFDKTQSHVGLVKDWERFRNTCKAHNCTEAVSKLDDIFPLLLKKGE
jgi:hypothetical protein